MKKLLSAIAVLCLLLSTSVIAFASETPSVSEVNEKLEAAGTYVASQKYKYEVADAYNLERIIRYTDIDEDYVDYFIGAVKQNLNDNGGRIIVSVYDYYTDTYTDVESVSYYASVIRALDELGEDVTDFNGVDLTQLFLSYDAGVALDNPYIYSNAVYVAAFFGSDALAKEYIDTMIANYYVMGSGMNYWGFSCDNTAHFVEALEFYGDEYADYLKDAVNVIKSYKLDKGYFSDTVYTTDANADSTALTLQAYCIAKPYLDDMITDDDLADTYNMLCGFETNHKGQFDYTDNTTPNVFATADAVVGLGEYLPYLMVAELPDDDFEIVGEIPDKNTPDGIDKATMTTTNKKDDAVKSPATGVSGSAVALGVAIAGAGVLTVLSAKKREQ